MTMQGNIIHDGKLIANQLNKYFVEIGPKLSSHLPNKCGNFSEYLKPVDCEFLFTTISNDIIFKKIMKIKSNKADGLDKIPQIIKGFCSRCYSLSESYL